MGRRIYTETEEIKVTRKKEWVYLDDDFMQVYNCLFDAFVKSKSVVETQLLLYLFSDVNKSGLFEIGKDTLDGFNEAMESRGGRTISKITFYKCLKNLVENKVVAKLSKGEYQLNPKYLWKDTQVKREEMIKDIMQLPDEDKIKFLDKE